MINKVKFIPLVFLMAACTTPETQSPEDAWRGIQGVSARPLHQAMAICEPRAEIARRNAEQREDTIQRFERQASPSGGGSAGAAFATGFMNQRVVQMSGRRAFDAQMQSCMADLGWVRTS